MRAFQVRDGVRAGVGTIPHLETSSGKRGESGWIRVWKDVEVDDGKEMSPVIMAFSCREDLPLKRSVHEEKVV